MLTPGDGQVTLGWIVTTGHWTPALEFTTDVYRDGALIELDRFVDDEVSNGESYEYQVVAIVEGGEVARSPRMTAHVGNHYDTDGDNLIEIGNLEQLNALRWDLDGNGLVDASANKDSYGGADGAFPGAAPGMGCNETVGCKGYELKEDLDSPTPIATPAKSTPLGRTDTEGEGWLPIGVGFSLDLSTSFTAVFDGNGRTIFNLFIDRTSSDYAGLFGSVAGTGAVRRLGWTGERKSDRRRQRWRHRGFELDGRNDNRILRRRLGQRDGFCGRPGGTERRRHKRELRHQRGERRGARRRPGG